MCKRMTPEEGLEKMILCESETHPAFPIEIRRCLLENSCQHLWLSFTGLTMSRCRED